MTTGKQSDGWRDIATAPKDGTPIIGACFGRYGDVYRVWWQPEFGWIESCREMSLAPGLTFENGESKKLHSPDVRTPTHWTPLPEPPVSK